MTATAQKGRPGMTRQDAETLLDRLLDAGFVSGIDCACRCLDGHYTLRSRRAGQPRSDRWAVSCTPLGSAEEFKRIVEEGTLTAHRVRNDGRTYDITGWTPDA